MYRENLKRYWKEHIVHLGVGIFAGLLLTYFDLPLAGITVMGTVWVRQGLEFLKRHDTPGIDLAYHLGGLVTGVAVGLIIGS